MINDRLCPFDKAVQDQQLAVDNAVNRIRSNISETAPNFTHCSECGEEISVKRRDAGRVNNLPIVYCVECQEFIEGRK